MERETVKKTDDYDLLTKAVSEVPQLVEKRMDDYYCCFSND